MSKYYIYIQFINADTINYSYPFFSRLPEEEGMFIGVIMYKVCMFISVVQPVAHGLIDVDMRCFVRFVLIVRVTNGILYISTASQTKKKYY